MLALSGNENLVIKHFDAKTVFLTGELKENIYMRQPEGYVKAGEEQMVCRLKKGLYGLKQAAKVWYEKLNSILKGYDFLQSKVDSCLYIKKSGNNLTSNIVHVDDFLIAASEFEKINEVSDFLKTKFKLIDLGISKRYRGIEVRKNSDNFYCIIQTKYIETILRRFGLEDSRPSNIPLDTGYLKNKKDQPSMDQSDRYQQFIGALLYVVVNTRPDITASVTILSQYNKRIGRYLRGTKDYELTLGKCSEE